MVSISQTGVNWPSITENGKYEPFELQAARGQITNHTVVSIFGYQASIPTSGFIPIWENNTAYTYPASATTMLLYSSSSSDAGVSILINGLDASYNPISETITFTAGNYTGVTTTNSYLRINNMIVTAVPSAGSSNAGVIYLQNAGKTITYAQIAVGVGRTQSTVYTVPNGYTFYLKRTQGFTNMSYAATSTGIYRTWQVNSAGVNSLITQRPFVANFTVERWYPNVYGQKTDIQWQMQAVTSSFAAGFSAEGILVANDTATTF
jgi:hypothetical protein